MSEKTKNEIIRVKLDDVGYEIMRRLRFVLKARAPKGEIVPGTHDLSGIYVGASAGKDTELQIAATDGRRLHYWLVPAKGFPIAFPVGRDRRWSVWGAWSLTQKEVVLVSFPDASYPNWQPLIRKKPTMLEMTLKLRSDSPGQRYFNGHNVAKFLWELGKVTKGEHLLNAAYVQDLAMWLAGSEWIPALFKQGIGGVGKSDLTVKFSNLSREPGFGIVAAMIKPFVTGGGEPMYPLGEG